MEDKLLRREIREPLPQEVMEAARQPNGWVYRILGNFSENDAVPPEAIMGAWKVNSSGMIEGEFIPNPNFDPNVQKRHLDAS